MEELAGLGEEARLLLLPLTDANACARLVRYFPLHLTFTGINGVWLIEGHPSLAFHDILVDD